MRTSPHVYSTFFFSKYFLTALVKNQQQIIYIAPNKWMAYGLLYMVLYIDKLKSWFSQGGQHNQAPQQGSHAVLPLKYEVSRASPVSAVTRLPSSFRKDRELGPIAPEVSIYTWWSWCVGAFLHFRSLFIQLSWLTKMLICYSAITLNIDCIYCKIHIEAFVLINILETCLILQSM